MFKRIAILAAVLALAAGPAFARHCPMDMKQIDEALAKMPKLTDAQMAEIKKLRAEGEDQHKAGNHPASEATLEKAKKILGLM